MAERRNCPLSTLDAAHMMVLLEVARTQLDSFNDDWRDMAGDAAVAAEISARMGAEEGCQKRVADGHGVRFGPISGTLGIRGSISADDPNAKLGLSQPSVR